MNEIYYFTEEAKEFIWGKEEGDGLTDCDISSEGLQRKISQIPTHTFVDYIRKYIYWTKIHLEEKGIQYADVDDSRYRKEARKAFAENGFGVRKEKENKKVEVLCNSQMCEWIKGQFRHDAYTADRQTVLLWAFGLGMSVESASLMLTKANKEMDFYFKNPYEVICYYCLKKGLRYPNVERLLEKYVQLVNDKEYRKVSDSRKSNTMYCMYECINIQNEEELLKYLMVLTKILIIERKINDEILTVEQVISGKFVSQRVMDEYNILLKKYKEVVYTNVINVYLARKQKEKKEVSDWIDKYNAGNIDDICKTFDDLVDKWCEGEGAKEYDRLEKAKSSGDEIKGYEIIGYLNEYYALPIDEVVKKEWITEISLKWGKWLRDARFDLNTLRTNREDGDISRANIITLVFLNYVYELKDEPEQKLSTKRRYEDFMDEVCAVLESCNMFPFYIGNPFECFIALCLLDSEDPEKIYKIAMAKAIRDNRKKKKTEV